MRTTTFTVRVDVAAKTRLEKLAKSTGRSRSLLAAEAINEYLDVNEWRVAGIKQAIASMDRDEVVSHERVKDWVKSWGNRRERPIPAWNAQLRAGLARTVTALKPKGK